MNSIDGVLKASHQGDSIEPDYKLAMVELFQQGDIKSARKLLCSQARPEEMVDIYRWLYDNVELFGDDSKQEKAILIIKQGLADHALVSDPEINLSATLIRLGHLNG